MKRYLAILLVFNVLFLTGCGAQKDTKEAEKPIAVSVQKVQGGEIQNMNTFTGTTKVATETSVTAEMGGTVEKIYVSLGQVVKKGDTLLTLKGDDINNSVKQAQAALDLAKANYTNLTDGTVQNQTNQLENSLKLAQMQYDEAQRNYDIYKQLYESGAASEDQYKKIELSLNQAQQQLDLAKNSYNTSTEKSIPEAKELAQKQLEQAQTSYDVAASNLDKLTLIAPVDGIITAKNFDEKEIASQATPAFVISNPNSLEIDLNITESDISKFKNGEDVNIKINGQDYSGKVEYVPTVTDSKTSLYVVKVLLDNNDGSLKGGMSADVELSIEKQEDALSVPKKAVFEEDGEKYLYTVQDNKAVKTAVETGIETDKRTEVKSGITNDDIVVIGGINLISDGSSIFPVEKED